MRTRILLPLALFALAGAFPGAALAGTSTVIRGSFDNGYESFVDTEVCAAEPWGFDVEATEH